MSWQAASKRLHQGRTLHLQQGPIDLLVCCEGSVAAVECAYTTAETNFRGLLAGLVDELTLLRTPLTAQSLPCHGPVARRMLAAVKPFAACGVTPMAAVAGAVADHILQVLRGIPGLHKIWVNNGGDIAIHLTAGQRFDCGIVDDLRSGSASGRIHLSAGDRIGGVATSGAASGGRSFSLGIADAVTVLADNAATADVAATLIANRVDLPGHPAITRRAANQIDPDSDLRERQVTLSIGALHHHEVAQALHRGWQRAGEMLRAKHIHAAVLRFRGQQRWVHREDATNTLLIGEHLNDN